MVQLKKYQVWWCNNYEPEQEDYMVFETDDLEYAEEQCEEFNDRQEDEWLEYAEVYGYDTEFHSPSEWYEIREV